MSPVCLPSSLLLSVCLYLCLTLFFPLDDYNSLHCVQTWEQSPPPCILIPLCLAPFSLLRPPLPLFSRLHSSNYSWATDLWSTRGHSFIELLFLLCVCVLPFSSTLLAPNLQRPTPIFQFFSSLETKTRTTTKTKQTRLFCPLWAHLLCFRFKACAYLVDVCYLWPHVVLLDRLLFGFPAWEWQHHLRGMGHPEERRDSSVILIPVHIDGFRGPSNRNTHWPHACWLLVIPLSV